MSETNNPQTSLQKHSWKSIGLQQSGIKASGGKRMGEEREKTLSYQILIIHFLKGIRRELVICCLTQLTSSCISHLGWAFLPSVGLLSLGIGYRDWDTTRSNGGWEDTGTCTDKNMFKNVVNIPLLWKKKFWMFSEHQKHPYLKNIFMQKLREHSILSFCKEN